MDTELTDHRPAPSWAWLVAAGIALIVACVVPPVSLLARRYLFVESAQFCVFAMAAPALVVLGAPLRLGASGAGRLLSHGSARLLAGGDRRYRPSFRPVLGYLTAWVAICLFWRLPPVLDQLARRPVLVVAEAATLTAAGIGLWLKLARPRPLVPRAGHLQRACAAALAMWSIWVIAYVLGFASGSVVHGYDGAGSHLLTVDDQEITAFLLWAAAAAAFLPVVFTAALTWLKDGSERPGEPARGTTATTGVRGWGPRAR
jgi:cytochrome c oxidase assembly factor CtaG